MTRTLTLLFTLAAGCATQSAAMPEQLRPTWDRCEPAVVRHCEHEGHGDPAAESRCMRETSNRFATTGDEAPLRRLGCTAP